MLCCLWPSTTSIGQSVSPYPGRRGTQVSSTGNGTSSVPQQSGSHGNAQSANETVNVIVPEGMEPGQTIHVVSPDGNQVVSATIPAGIGPGQTFYVSIPKAPSNSQPTTSTSSNNGNKDQSNQSTTKQAAPPAMPPLASPLHTQADQSSRPFSQALDDDLPNASASPQHARTNAPATGPFANQSPNPNQKLLLVNVPPGSTPGSTIHVQVPGENRTLAARVPPGVTQFHVAYEPRTPPSPLPATTSNGQKLMLVHVPPGTAPGTTLHVKVPDEPGRMLAATVPPNATEFQVAYTPRNPNHSNNPLSGHGNVRPQQAGMGSSFIPFVGGAALAGAAGLAMYDHYHHHQNVGQSNYGGDYGADNDGDYGGDFGGDFGDF